VKLLFTWEKPYNVTQRSFSIIKTIENWLKKSIEQYVGTVSQILATLWVNTDWHRKRRNQTRHVAHENDINYGQRGCAKKAGLLYRFFEIISGWKKHRSLQSLF